MELGSFTDGIRLTLCILRFWVTMLMVLSRYKILRFGEYDRFFTILVYFLGLVLLVTFLVGDYLLFYFFFEISLIPTFLIIMGWGYQPERLQAGVYFIFYTLIASLPLLFGIVYLGKLGFSNSFYFAFAIIDLRFRMSVFIPVIFRMAFLVRLPMYITHL